MTVISAKIKNFKKLRDVEIRPDGKSFMIIGDTREGKSTLIEAILSSLMLENFPSNPLTTGEKNGEIEITHNIDGVNYIISRKFTDKETSKTRFTVKDEKGMNAPSLEKLLERLFGKAFTNNYFDYNKFFFECKTTKTRTDYIVKAMGGDVVFDNHAKIKLAKVERGRLGGEKTKYQHIVEHSSLNPETVEQDLLTYGEEKTFDEAIAKKNEILLTRQSVTNLSNQLSIIKEGNSAFEIAQDSLDGVNEEIKELILRLEELNRKKLQIEKWKSENPADKAAELEIEEKIQNLETDNLKIEENASTIYDDMVMEVNVHNNMHNELKTAISAYNEFIRYNTEWTEKDDEINSMLAKNKTIFSERLNIPGMTIDDVDGELVVMYNGRELAWDNVSKGESIRITMQIQKFLNPKGNNFIVIPEAQSLGSDLDEILKECADQDIQAIVEMTERKQQFRIEFIEELDKN